MYILIFFYKRVDTLLKKGYVQVMMQRTSRLVIDTSTVESRAFLFGGVVTDRV